MIAIKNLDTHTTYYADTEDETFDIIHKITGNEELAIEMSSWADLATVDEQWIKENVEVAILDD